MNETNSTSQKPSLKEYFENERVKHMYESLGLLRALRAKRTHQAVVFGTLLILSFLGMCVGGAGMIGSITLSEIMVEGFRQVPRGLTKLCCDVPGFEAGLCIFLLFLVAFLIVLILWILKESAARSEEQLLLNDINKEGVFELW